MLACSRLSNGLRELLPRRQSRLKGGCSQKWLPHFCYPCCWRRARRIPVCQLFLVRRAQGRVRRGFIASGNSGDSIAIKGQFENVIADHVSASWATDENLTLTNANNVTAQYSIAAEGLDYYNPEQSPFRHSEGSLFGSQTPR